jgi:hypothetical protein
MEEGILKGPGSTQGGCRENAIFLNISGRLSFTLEFKQQPNRFMFSKDKGVQKRPVTQKRKGISVLRGVHAKPEKGGTTRNNWLRQAKRSSLLTSELTSSESRRNRCVREVVLLRLVAIVVLISLNGLP